MPDAGAEATVALIPAQAHQVASVLRLKPGDRIRVFDGQSDQDYLVELRAVRQDRAEGDVVGRVPNAPDPKVGLWAYPALLPRDNFERVLQKLTEVGVSGIVPVITRRSLAQRPPSETQVRRWRQILVEAAEQSGRGHVPVLGECLRFAEAIAQATQPGGRVFVADLDPSGVSIADVWHGSVLGAERIGLLVGPEGGFASDEVEMAVSLGARRLYLGPRVLRAETASPVLAALLLAAAEAGYPAQHG